VTDAAKGQRVDFRAGGRGQEYLIEGWSYPEAEYTWSLGQTSIVRFSHEGRREDHALLLRGAPLVREGALPFQRLEVVVNGAMVARLVLRAKTQIELMVPAAVIGDGPAVEVVFHWPDATAPSELGGSGDSRALAFAMGLVELRPLAAGARSAVAAQRAEDRAMLMDIQSLGANCELGMVQRHFGAEPFGLFRWASTPLPNLVRALEARFEGFGLPENLDVWMDDATEFHVIDKVFGFKNHSFAFQNKGAKREDILRREAARLPFLKRLLIEELEAGSKLYCFHDGNQSSLDDINKLVAALNKYGRNVLVWVKAIGKGENIGDVNIINHNLIAGYIDYFEALGNVTQPSFNAWLKMLRSAHGVWNRLL
jgi:hypothetical protein